MTVAFRRVACEELAGIPARVIDVWPRMRSGAYLVSLEYSVPVRLGNELVQQIEAFADEVYQTDQPSLVRRAPAVRGLASAPHGRMSMLQYATGGCR